MQKTVNEREEHALVSKTVSVYMSGQN